MDKSPPKISSCPFCHLEKAVETQGLNILKMSLCRLELGGQQAGERGAGEGLPHLFARPWLNVATCYII